LTYFVATHKNASNNPTTKEWQREQLERLDRKLDEFAAELLESMGRFGAARHESAGSSEESVCRWSDAMVAKRFADGAADRA
jgi:hypothetical protein